LRNPRRATVTHFFAPAWRNPAVEVIDWERVDADLVEHLRRFFCETGKLPLVTADAPCFMLDRIFDNWCNESALLLDRANAAQVDTVASDYVHAGPFFVLNLAHGNPIIVETNTLQADEEGEHYRPAPIFGSVERWLTIAPGKSVRSTRKARPPCAIACSACCSRSRWTSSTATSAKPPTSTSAAGSRSASARARSR